MKKLNSNRKAMLYTKLPGLSVRCGLCPRRCVISDGKTGFCKVRMNREGVLYAISYGKAVHISEEFIETEAVFHFEPGSRILSIGNVGCNLSCVYCQNWRFSQIEHVNEDFIFEYTPEEIVKKAVEKNIKILSWTYNDPAIWLEFVYDTAKLSKKYGIYNLFKSAFFLTPEAIELLMEVMDIFSISVKSLNQDFYRKLVHGWIEPVLKGAKQVFDGKRHHLEISNLVVTQANDTREDFMKVINWAKDNLSVDVPLHFVRFHPDYKYTHVEKTPAATLETAYELARQAGMRHCYVGNLFIHKGLNTYCDACGALLVERRGLNAVVAGLEAGAEGYVCKSCGSDTNIKMIKKDAYEVANI